MARKRILIRGGHVLTMDPELGNLPAGDVLVEDGVIRAIAPSIAVDDAEIIDATDHTVLPGLIDTHRHTWQTQLRAICADWTVTDYFYAIRATISPLYAAEDVYLGNYLGALDALNSGVTTLLDFSHCNNTPDHSDAAVLGLKDAGIRAVHGYGFYASAPENPAFPVHADRITDFHRIADTYFADDGGLLTLGVSLTEVGLIPWPETVAEITAARERDALVVTHTAAIFGSELAHGIREMDAAGLLDSNQVHVHCTDLADDEWQALSRAGAKVSIAVETELNMGMGRPPFAKCAQYGVKPTLSCDVISLNSGDLFSQLRMGVAFKRWADSEHINLAGAMPDTVSTTVTEALSWCTVNAADAVGMADRIGSLRVGKQADLIVLGGRRIGQHPRVEPAGSIIFQATPEDVRTVLVAGRVVKRDGTLVGVDLPSVLGRADESARSVLARAHEITPELPPRVEGGLDVLEDMIKANLAVPAA